MLFTTQDKTLQVVRVEPLEAGTKGLDVLMEALSREYVSLRENFDFQTEQARWQKAIWYSSEELGEAFKQHITKTGNDSPFEQFKKRGITRSINILSSTALAPSAPNVWQVEWESIDRDTQTGSETRGYWVSTITAECIEKNLNYEDQFINPIGFTVLHYTVANKQSLRSTL